MLCAPGYSRVHINCPIAAMAELVWPLSRTASALPLKAAPLPFGVPQLSPS